jgi:hypothetical protein
MATSTNISSALVDVPAILKPYITDAGGILPAAKAITAQDYATTYGTPLAQAGLAGSGRIAGLSDMQKQIGTTLQGMGTPSQFGTGTQAAQSGIGTSILNEGDILQGSPAYFIGDYKKSYIGFRKLPELQNRIEELEKLVKELQPQKNG